MIETRNITKQLSDTIAVDNVSLTIPRGKLTAIIGPNGAGKSSLLSIIARQLAADRGEVQVGGMDAFSADSRDFAKRLSFLRQDNSVNSRLRVSDVVLFGRFPHSRGRYTDTDRDAADKAISYMALEDLTHRYLDELSGGQRQRVFVAMILAQDTEYMLLDEPLNNLDMKHAVSMMKLVKRATLELGKTVAVVLHDINFASCYADHIVVMQEGRLAYQGEPAAVITPVIMREVYGIDVAVHTIAGQIISVFYT